MSSRSITVFYHGSFITFIFSYTVCFCNRVKSNPNPNPKLFGYVFCCTQMIEFIDTNKTYAKIIKISSYINEMIEDAVTFLAK